MNDLVKRLSKEQAVEVSRRPEPTATAFGEALNRGYIHLRFPGTRGGTELGATVDPRSTDVSAADFAGGTGTIVIVGDLTLDYVPVRLHAKIDLPTLKGTGYLEPIESVA